MAFAFSVWLTFSKNFQAQKKKYEGKQTTGLRTKHNYPYPLYFFFQLPALIKQHKTFVCFAQYLRKYKPSYFQF